MAPTVPDFPLTRGGYEFTDVHRFTKWVKERLAVTDTLPQDAMDELQLKTVSGRGYEITAVDEWIASLPSSATDPETEAELPAELRHYSAMEISADRDGEQTRLRLYIAVTILAAVLIWALLTYFDVLG